MQAITEFWKVQNTGYTGGVSWFDSRGVCGDSARFDTERAARQYARETRWGDKDVKWRLVRVRIENTDKQRVTTETFFTLRAPRRRADQA